MSLERVITNQALQDMRNAARYLAEHASTHHAATFRDKLFELIGTLQESPGVGSPCDQSSTGLPNVRRAQVKKYHYLVYYVYDDANLIVLRLLHPARDLKPRYFE